MGGAIVAITVARTVGLPPFETVSNTIRAFAQT
ncbi:hypothetical protein U716_07690 [Rhodobacter capsulatus B6]|nr:hypothetical protein U716_07680 [Rhodobacter capsulatus B6]ETD84380.1 hypothetical protein U716_07690 [Rhodobacter capsulatus B6]